jgi:phosphoserine phosphatase
VIKAVLIDFDGTLVYKDILSVLCGIVGKEIESESLNKEFHMGIHPGVDSLIERINFLQGVSIAQIKQKLNENLFLMKGAQELIDYLNQNRIATILHSGNIVPVLEYYQRLIGITYVVGTCPVLKGETIVGITEKDLPGPDFKLLGVQEILHKIGIKSKETLAIGDSPADKLIFPFAGKSIAINPKEEIDKFANYTILNDLSLAMQIIKDLNQKE